MVEIKVGDTVRIESCDGSKRQMYGHEVGDIGIVKEITERGRIFVFVEGRVSTSQNKPYVTYRDTDLELLKVIDRESAAPIINNTYALY